MMPVEITEFRRANPGKGRVLDKLHQPNKTSQAEGRRCLEGLCPRQPFGRATHARRQRQLTTRTGVPCETLAKKICAMRSGMRIQPCEAAKPGRNPACMPTPPWMRIK